VIKENNGLKWTRSRPTLKSMRKKT